MPSESNVNPLELAELEKLQFSCDLHDGILQFLIGARFSIESLRNHVPKLSSEEIVSQLSEVESILQKGIVEGRRWVGSLRGEKDYPSLSLSSLFDKVVDEFRRSEDRVTLFTDLDPAGLETTFPIGVRTAIFRIVEEALRNASRHGRAKTIWITVSHETGSHPWLLEIQDDGIGFDVDAIPEDHYGILGMKTRADLIGALLEIKSERGHGSKIRLAI